MQSISNVPNLLLIGGPKCGTTSLLTWMRKHPEIYHPWEKMPISASESGFLLGGISDIPFSPTKPKGTLLMPNEINMVKYRQEKWIIDKSPQHLYSKRALDTVRELLPNAKIIITIRDPFDLLISWHGEMNKGLNYDTSFNQLLEKLDDKNWVIDDEDEATWSFLTYPQYSNFIRSWIEMLGEDRVRVIKLSTIAKKPVQVLESISKWLGIDPKKMPQDLVVKNVRGRLSNNPLRRLLRKPPDFIFTMARIILPSRALRKMILDPIRRLGWKHVSSSKDIIPPELENKIRDKFSDDIEFFKNLEEYIPNSIIID